MKYIDNKLFMAFLNRGRNDFGWSTTELLNQILSVCSVLTGGVENPKILDETREGFMDLFRDSSKGYDYLWSASSIANVILKDRSFRKSPDSTFKLFFELCRGVGGKRWGSGVFSPIR